MSIEDSPADHRVISSTEQASNPVFGVVEEEFEFGDSSLTRQYAKHLGAVGVVAVNDHDEVLMIRQYRHPVRRLLWEVPAGLLDDSSESMLEAAQRELHEEADLTAERWSVLTDYFPTPGMSNEACRVYLAEEVATVAEADRHAREAEESELITQWVPLQEAVRAVLEGRVHNGPAVVGILAVQAMHSTGIPARDTAAQWEEHPRGFTA